jgi:cytidylate kinase
MSTALKFLIVAIDGGAASGKSSTACALAERFNYLHADTGSYYRALTADLLHRGVRAGDHAGVQAELVELRPAARVVGREAHLVLHGDEISAADIRSEAVNRAVSHFAAMPEVRSALLAAQRGLPELAKKHGFRGVIVEGRDIGSVIFPHADLRVYLSADPAARAQRRAKEGHTDAVAERDRLDSSRESAPLTCPAGALCIDSTQLTLPEVVERVALQITARLLGGT